MSLTYNKCNSLLILLVFITTGKTVAAQKVRESYLMVLAFDTAHQRCLLLLSLFCFVLFFFYLSLVGRRSWKTGYTFYLFCKLSNVLVTIHYDTHETFLRQHLTQVSAFLLFTWWKEIMILDLASLIWVMQDDGELNPECITYLWIPVYAYQRVTGLLTPVDQMQFGF